MAVFNSHKRRLKLKYGISVMPDKYGKYPGAVADRLVRGGIAEEVQEKPKRGRKKKEYSDK